MFKMFSNAFNTASVEIGIIIFPVAFLVVFLSIFLPVQIVRQKYIKFIDKHSAALKQLRRINSIYEFKIVQSFDMENSYDNENFYNNISPRDYLTYQLVYIHKKVNQALADTLSNKNLYFQYTKEIKDTCVFGKYDLEAVLSNRKKLMRFEKKIFADNIKKPKIEFSIYVNLRLTNINGTFKSSKANTFYPGDIKGIIAKLNQKNGTFFLNNEIWASLCRVERGKVTNKVRFSIYKRDHYRCKKCGIKINDLEIDHIIPIAKGGKSTYDNLQTLCRNCNYKKGSSLDY